MRWVTEYAGIQLESWVEIAPFDLELAQEYSAGSNGRLGQYLAEFRAGIDTEMLPASTLQTKSVDTLKTSHGVVV